MTTAGRARIDRHAPAYHPTYVRLLCAALRAEGHSAERVLAAAGLSVAALASTEQFLSHEQLRGIALAAQRALPRPALAFELGAATELAWHGPLGYAVAASTTLRDALGVVARFGGLVSRALAFRLEPEPHGAGLVIEERVELGDVRGFVLEHTLAALAQLMRSVLGHPLTGASVEVPFAPPAHRGAYKVLFTSVRFGAPRCAISLRDKLLDAPCIGAAPDRFAAARRECERAERQQRSRDTLAGRVETVLGDASRLADSLAVVAQGLGVSRRTASRRLKSQGESFRGLRDGARRRLALQLLRDPSLSVAEIARRLGYTEASNFSRTCRRWFDATPQALRAGKAPWPEDDESGP